MVIYLNKNSIAEVVISNPIWSLDKYFQYKIPKQLIGIVKKGMKVLVPFGNGNKKTEAYVINIVNTCKVDKLKSIYNVIGNDIILDDKMLNLALWIKNKYICTFYEAIKTVLPPASKDKTVRLVSLSIPKEDTIEYMEKIKHKAPAQSRILEILLDCDCISAKDLISFAQASYTTLKIIVR